MCSLYWRVLENVGTRLGMGGGVKLGYSYNSKEFFPGHFTSVIYLSTLV